MNKPIRKILFFLTLALYGCGTGPWYIQKNLYNTYKEPLYQNSDIKFRTDGFYAQVRDSENIDYSTNILVFNVKGYSVSMNYAELQNLIKNKKSIKAELDWWKIKNDSIIIENYGETKRLIKTMVWWYKGKVLNDSIIEIAYQDDNYKYSVLKYKFIESDNIPELENEGRYSTKKWYLSKLNETRK